MVFELPIVEDKIKPHQVTTLHLISALAFIVTGEIIVVYNYTIPNWGAVLLFAGIAILCFTIFKNKWVLSPVINRGFRIAELVIALTVASYSLYEQWRFPSGIFCMLTAVTIFALFWERTAGDIMFVFIDEEGIKLPITSRKRFIDWRDVELVVLRFDTLTINCADDRLFQWHIGDVEVNDSELENYCTQKVEENKSRRVEDW